MSHATLPIHVMLDLETLGTKPGCAIISIAAVPFYLPDDISIPAFYLKVSRDSNILYGFHEDPRTLEWWFKQSFSSQEEAFSGTLSVLDMLSRFNDYLARIKHQVNSKHLGVECEIYLWGNSAAFDLGILGAAYDMCWNGVRPWNFRNEMCYRTLKNTLHHIPMETFLGVKHSALADATNQAAHAEVLLDYINELGE